MKTLTKYLPLLISLLLATFIFFYRLDTIPSGFYIDEGLPGYSAFSLLNTGKDEFGKFFPIALRFYGFYGPPLFTYSVIPLIALLGPTVMAVRSTSALYGLFGVLLIYLLAKYLLKQPSKQAPTFLATILFLISPWVVLYARFGAEVLPAGILLGFGALCTYLGLNKPKLFLLASLLLSASTYASYAARFQVPIFIVIFSLVFLRSLKRSHLPFLISSIVLGLLLQLPHFYLLTTPAFFPKTSLFYSSSASPILEFFSQYFNYLSPKSLFFLPDPDPQRSIPRLAVFYSWMFIPYLLGLWQLYKHRAKPEFKFIWIMLLVFPIPAALSHDPFASHRAFALVIPLILVITLGLKKLLTIFPRFIRPIILIVLVVFSLRQLYLSYFLLLPVERARYWDYGVLELSQEISKLPQYHFIIDQANVMPSYPNLAFFLHYPPQKMQQELDPSSLSTYYFHPNLKSPITFANLTLRKIDWQTDIYTKQILVGDELAISADQAKEHFLTPVFVIKDPLGQIRFQGFRTNPSFKCAYTFNKSPLCVKL